MTVWLMLQDEIDRVEALLSEHISASELESTVHAVEPMTMGRGGVATINVSGPILNRRSAILDFFGAEYSTYPDIRSQIDDAKKGGAKRIDIRGYSPGGTLDGLYETMDAIKNAGVKTRTIVGPTAASAMYMLASQTGEIVAENDLSMVGSVGIVYETTKGGKRRSVTNTDSPKKRPDVATEDGQAVVREQLDDMYQVLAEKIGIGRGVSPEVVKRDYGQGAMMTARQAKQRGLIDSIGVATNKPTAPAAANQGDRMNAKELKAEHRDVYDEIFALGEENGVKTERKRVSAHLVLADGSGDMDAAVEAIHAGDDVDQLVMAKHSAAAMKRDMRQARADDNPDVPEAKGEDRNAQAAADAKALADFQAANPGCTVEVDIPNTEVN